MSKKKKKNQQIVEETNKENVETSEETSTRFETIEEVAEEAKKIAETEDDENVIYNRRTKETISIIAFYDIFSKKTHKIAGKGLKYYALYQVRMMFIMLLTFFLIFNVHLPILWACIIALVLFIVTELLFRFLYLHKQPIITPNEEEVSLGNEVGIRVRIRQIADQQPYGRIIRMILLCALILIILFYNITQRRNQGGAYSMQMIVVYIVIAIIAVEVSLLGLKLGSAYKESRAKALGGKKK